MMIFQIFKLILFIAQKCLGLYYLELIFSERSETEMCFIYISIFIYLFSWKANCLNSIYWLAFFPPDVKCHLLYAKFLYIHRSSSQFFIEFHLSICLSLYYITLFWWQQLWNILISSTATLPSFLSHGHPTMIFYTIFFKTFNKKFWGVFIGIKYTDLRKGVTSL